MIMLYHFQTQFSVSVAQWLRMTKPDNLNYYSQIKIVCRLLYQFIDTEQSDHAWPCWHTACWRADSGLGTHTITSQPTFHVLCVVIAGKFCLFISSKHGEIHNLCCHYDVYPIKLLYRDEIYHNLSAIENFVSPCCATPYCKQANMGGTIRRSKNVFFNIYCL